MRYNCEKNRLMQKCRSFLEKNDGVAEAPKDSNVQLFYVDELVDTTILSMYLENETSASGNTIQKVYVKTTADCYDNDNYEETDYLGDFSLDEIKDIMKVFGIKIADV